MLEKFMSYALEPLLIKLSIYRTLASINTKWLGGTNCKDNSPFKQCTCKTGSDNTYDKTVAENEKISEPDLIHSFRFGFSL